MSSLRNLTSLALIGSTMVGTLTLAAVSVPTRSDAVTAIFPPWWTKARALAAAAGAGDVVGLGHLPTSVVVHGEPAVLTARLRAVGALLVVDLNASSGCGATAWTVGG